MAEHRLRLGLRLPHIPDVTEDLPMSLEILSVMRRKESCLNHGFGKETARHIRYRTMLVEWVIDVCEDFELSLTTATTAVLYSDQVLSKVKVPKTSLQLVAMCCVLLAAKFEEPETKVPLLHHLNECSNNLYTIELIRKMEMAVLNELGWGMTCVTPAHFLETFLALTCGATSRSDIVGGGAWQPKTVEILQRYSAFFVTICLLDMDMTTEFPPSMVAAAVIAASRWQLQIQPLWTPSLQAATGFSEQDIGPCLSKVVGLYLDKYPDTATENVTPERRAGPPQGDVEMHPATPNGKGVPSPTGPLEAWAEFH
mmetsp:Transcript_65803/g.208264  ORF Transcript_65803/g.208264 Transcript_65803/m.208264 type:complete len:312 (+) Transcript_65803:414-1349(+)